MTELDLLSKDVEINTILPNKKQTLIVIKEYYDLKLKKKMTVNETFKADSDRANTLISKGFVIRK